MVAIIIGQEELSQIEDQYLVDAYEHLRETFNRYPNGFGSEFAGKRIYPHMWYMRVMRCLLDIYQDSDREKQIYIIKVIFKINIIYKNIFTMEPFCNNYKHTTIMKAHYFLNDDVVPLDVKNILRYFLNVVN